MPIQVFKYPLAFCQHQRIETTDGIRPLTVQLQKGVPTMWALVDNLAPWMELSIYTYTTGQEIDNLDAQKYLATYQLDNGEVYHVFTDLVENQI